MVDNVAAGPAIGGVRMRPDITAGEVARLARAMTMKNALAGLPHGGGKSGIAAPGLAASNHERVAAGIRPDCLASRQCQQERHECQCPPR